MFVEKKKGVHQFKGKNVVIDNGVAKKTKDNWCANDDAIFATATCVSWSPCIFGKWLPLKLAVKNQRFFLVFSEFGLFSNTTDDAIAILEEFACCLLRDLKFKKVDELRVKLFQSRFNRGRKNINLVSLPPPYSKLRLYINRACYVANMFHESRRLMILLDDPIEHGWGLSIKVK